MSGGRGETGERVWTEAGYCLACCTALDGSRRCPACGGERFRPEPIDLRPGVLLANRYLIGRSLGRGGFGITYLAVDFEFRDRVVLKEYFPRTLVSRERDETGSVVPNSADDANAFRHGLDKFIGEGQKLYRCQGSQHVVGVLNAFRENGTGYLVMRYAPGRPLSQLIREYGGRLFEPQALQIVDQILRALSDVHAIGILHRDVKPGNVLVEDTETGFHVRLIDFGAARYTASGLSVSAPAAWTDGYAPPEQRFDRRDQHHWTDVYAAAATLHKLLTGAAPPKCELRQRKGEALAALDALPDVRPQVKAAIRRGLRLAPKRRFRSCEELRRALERAVAEDEVSPPPVDPDEEQARDPDDDADGPPAPPPRPPRRTIGPATAVFGALAALSILAVAVAPVDTVLRLALVVGALGLVGIAAAVEVRRRDEESDSTAEDADSDEGPEPGDDEDDPGHDDGTVELIFHRGPFAGERFPLLEGDIGIGRDGRVCAIVLPRETKGVSRHHLTVRVAADGRILLQDNNSTAGTWIDGERRAAGEWIAAGVGTCVELGSKAVAFHIWGPGAETLASPPPKIERDGR